MATEQQLTDHLAKFTKQLKDLEKAAKDLDIQDFEQKPKVIEIRSYILCLKWALGQ